jgi:hypothetical protein
MGKRKLSKVERAELVAFQRAAAISRERSGPTPPEAVVALYDAITGMIQVLQNVRCDCDEDDRETIAKAEFDLARWCERRAELDNWNLLDVRDALGRKDCWL